MPDTPISDAESPAVQAVRPMTVLCRECLHNLDVEHYSIREQAKFMYVEVNGHSCIRTVGPVEASELVKAIITAVEAKYRRWPKEADEGREQYIKRVGTNQGLSDALAAIKETADRFGVKTEG